MAPCNSKGREYTEKDDMFVDSPDELVGKEINFTLKIVNCRGLPNKYTVSHNYPRYVYQKSQKISAILNHILNNRMCIVATVST